MQILQQQRHPCPLDTFLVFFYFACSKFIAIQNLIILWFLAVFVVGAHLNSLDEIVPVSTTANYKLAETVLLINHNIYTHAKKKKATQRFL